jgi:hypothetical protein
MLRVRLRAFFAGGLAAIAAACGGPQFDGHVFRGDEVAFRVGPVPETWRRIDVSTAELAFRDDSTKVTVAVNARCGVDGDDVPLQALTHHLFLHFKDRRVESQEELMLDDRAALRTELLADLDGVRKYYVVYVLKKDGCVYDFLSIADLEATNPAPFDRFVHGFSTVRS